MHISFVNYRRMNDFLKNAIRRGVEEGLAQNNDDDLYTFQTSLEHEIGKGLIDGKVISVKSGTISRQLAKVAKTRYVIGVSSGTAALQFSLLSKGVGKGDEVITVPNSYIGMALGITNTGARPVFSDIENGTMLMDPKLIEEHITPNTKAIMPVHLYGQMANMNKISRIAKKHGLKVIEDAAHSPLARFNGKLPGEIGDCACYSFFPNKNLGAVTNGGFIITKDKKIFDRIKILRDPSADSPLLIKSHRTPAYLDWIQMVFIKEKLMHLKSWTERRRKIAGIYREGLAGLPLAMQSEQKNTYHVHCNFTIRLKGRNKLRTYLKNNGIETALQYPTALHLTKTLRHLGYKRGDFPIAERACDDIISLPMNPFLSDDELRYIIKKVRKFFKK